MSSSISFISVLQFSEYRSFISLGSFILRYCVLFYALVNGIVSFISFSDISLLVYRNATDFCVLILYLATLPRYVSISFFLIKKNFFFNFWLHWVFVAAHRLSLVASSGGYSSLQCTGFSLWVLLLWTMGSRHAGFSSCGSWALECRLSSCGTQAYLLRDMWDLPGPIPCIGRRILNHCTIREVLHIIT